MSVPPPPSRDDDTLEECRRCHSYNAPTAKFCHFCQADLKGSSGTLAIFEHMLREAIGQIRDSKIDTEASRALKLRAIDRMQWFRDLPDKEPRPSAEEIRARVNEAIEIATSTLTLIGVEL